MIQRSAIKREMQALLAIYVECAVRNSRHFVHIGAQGTAAKGLIIVRLTSKYSLRNRAFASGDAEK